MPPALSTEEIRHLIASRQWYHTLELADGVLTPGWFDHRDIVGRLPMPRSLAGKRCLDVGTFDGFWAFEMERRGASEVVAIDVRGALEWDWPALSEDRVVEALAARQPSGDSFRLAHETLGSAVQRRELSVYDVDPEELGTFDFVYLGSLLIHLRDPVKALERVRSVCGGELLLVDNHEPLLTLLFPRLPLARLDGRGRPWWWQPNAACVIRMVEAAGFELTRPPLRLAMPPGAGQQSPPLRPRTLFSGEGRRALRNARRGDPHVALLARPRDRPR
jgi:tRNA (mo5U34)-methyltransferase